MREIKFRAWDRDDDQMITGFGLTPDDLFPYIIPTGDASDDPANYAYYDNVELMQYTGLTDTKGVDVYEGDMFQDDEDESVNWVVYDPECAGFRTEGKDGHNWWEPSELVKAVTEHGYTVIGNIYENKDLLK
ncbi:Conserved hypothetical protein CHP1671 [uncultured Caudovirales phage]|uniref:YopX protein domain-containing protein n=1 Tax=uncultured Caudovirales phage TaxID=2100421 RepID=A0A6J5MZG5_9CAUD|nr:Conserved hypothetical protein CHP1671 [uncultured Caudovirales phage]